MQEKEPIEGRPARRRFGNRTSTWRVTACVAFLTLAVAACGGGNGDSERTTEKIDTTNLPPKVAAAVEEAQAAGLGFVTSREELMARAADEPPLKVIWARAPDESLEQFTDQFTEKYGVEVDEVQGMSTFEERQRFILEAEAGAVNDFGVVYAAAEAFKDIEKFCDWDIYGMAEAGIVDIPMEMIDPHSRTTISAGNSPAAFVYNLDAFKDRPLPETWEDIVDHPELYGSDVLDMVTDTRFFQLATMVDAWGLDRTVQYAKDLAALHPTWVSRTGPTVDQLALGEYDAYAFATAQSVIKRMEGLPSLENVGRDIIGDKIGVRLIEPIPVRMSDTHCVLNDDINPSPASSILFLEWLATDGQAAYHDPDNAAGVIAFENSIYDERKVGNAALADKFEMSVVDWDTFQDEADYIKKLSSAAGFPSAVDEEAE